MILYIEFDWTHIFCSSFTFLLCYSSWRFKRKYETTSHPSNCQRNWNNSSVWRTKEAKKWKKKKTNFKVPLCYIILTLFRFVEKWWFHNNNNLLRRNEETNNKTGKKVFGSAFLQQYYLWLLVFFGSISVCDEW